MKSVDLPDFDLTTLDIQWQVVQQCWASTCQKPPSHVLRTLCVFPDFHGKKDALRFIMEIGYCWDCLEFFSKNWLSYKNSWTLGYYALPKVVDIEGDEW